jgi:dihydrofolate reductase
MPSVELIYARDVDGLIGIDGKIPWKLSADLKRFKEKTIFETVMMGRKTFDSIGKSLPDRVNAVVTSRDIPIDENVNTLITFKVSDPVEYIKAFKASKPIANSPYMTRDSKLFIIGGRDLIVNEGFKHADVIHLTQIYKNHQHLVDMFTDAVYVPTVPHDLFKLESQTPIFTGEDLLTYNFITYRRR